MKHVFILNPFAGKKDSETYMGLISEYFSTHGGEYRILTTEYPGHASELAAGYTAEEDVCVYAFGGDGTAYEVLNGLNDGVAMALIPNGTGNDYFRKIMKEKGSIADILTSTIEGKTVNVDYGIVNNRKYLNSASMGLDADVVDLVNDIGKRYPIPKGMVYGVSALIKVVNPRPHSFRIQIDEKVFEQKALLIAVMNGSYYGGGFMPTPDASLQDGVLDVVIADDMKLPRIIQLLPKYMKGKHVGLKGVNCCRAQKVILDCDEDVLYQFDGEVRREKHIEFTLVKGGLRLRVPTSALLQ